MPESTVLDVYEGWIEKGGRPPFLSCRKTKRDIIEDIQSLEYKKRTGTYYDGQAYMYYMLYLQSVTPDDVLCFVEYQRDIAVEFEKSQRREFLNPANKQINERYNTLLNIPMRFWSKSFRTKEPIEHQAKMSEKTQAFIDTDYSTTYLLSTPQAGFGKTNEQVCLTKEYFIEKNIVITRKYTDKTWGAFSILDKSILFTTEQELYGLMRRTFEDGCPYNEQQVYEELYNVDFLAISDVFQDKNELKRRMMQTIIEGRVEERCKNLVLSTNLYVKTLSQTMPYIYSRLSRGLIFATTGTKPTEDLRRKYR